MERSRPSLVLAAVACAALSMAVSVVVGGAAVPGESWESYLVDPFALSIAVPMAALAAAFWLLAAAATLEPRDLGTTLPAAVLATVSCSALLTLALGPLVVPVALLAGWTVMVVGHRARTARPGQSR